MAISRSPLKWSKPQQNETAQTGSLTSVSPSHVQAEPLTLLTLLTLLPMALLALLKKKALGQQVCAVLLTGNLDKVRRRPLTVIRTARSYQKWHLHHWPTASARR